MKLSSLKRINNAQGFTLVELLIVVVLISILSGIGLSILNPVRQRQIAEDGVKRSNITKMVDTLEAYFSGEGSYPISTDFCNSSSILSKTYMGKCPNGEPNGAAYSYVQSGNSFGLLVTKSTNTSQCIKYRSSWQQPQDCTNCDVTSDSCTGVATHSYSQCGANTVPYSISISPTNLCQSGLTAGSVVAWQSTCSTVGTPGTCVHASCSGSVTDPCNSSFPTTSTTVTYAWDCVCQ